MSWAETLDIQPSVTRKTAAQIFRGRTTVAILRSPHETAGASLDALAWNAGGNCRAARSRIAHDERVNALIVRHPGYERSKFQQLLGVLVIHLALFLRREPELVDEVYALALEHEQRRRVGAEEEMVDPHRVDGTACA